MCIYIYIERERDQPYDIDITHNNNNNNNVIVVIIKHNNNNSTNSNNTTNNININNQTIIFRGSPSAWKKSRENKSSPDHLPQESQTLDIHYRGVQGEGGAVDWGSIM